MSPAHADRVTVLVLYGGPDAEREISIMSGTAVAQALRESNRFVVIDHCIDKPDLDALRELTNPADVVFPVLHGRWGEGGALQELLERIGKPYVGSGPKAAARAMDKLATKTLLTADHVATPPSRALLEDDDCDLDPPLVLKPVDDGSSVDLRICRSREEVAAARRELHPKRGRLLAERFIEGREITIGVISGEALPLIEIRPAKDAPFYNYQAKYFRDDTQYVLDPDLPPQTIEQARRAALTAFTRLGCRDVARSDFIVDDAGTAWFLEINTMPGFTSHSLVPMAARHRGWEMPELCSRLVDAAVVRAKQMPPVHA